MTKIDEQFLARLEEWANHAIETHEPSEMFPAMGPDIVLNANEVVVWVRYTRSLQGTAIDLLAEKTKAEEQLQQTQYLSTLWIKAITSVMPKKLQRKALNAAAQSIAEGMKQAGMEGYDVDLGKLEEQVRPE